MGPTVVCTASAPRQVAAAPPGGELLRLFQSSESLFYDETPVGRSVPGDRDEDATDEMLEAIQDQGLDVSGIPRDRLLRNWGLIDDQGHPTLIFLDIEPPR